MKPKNRHAAALGKKGGKAGTGKAKARSSEQARAAAKSRWEKERLTNVTQANPVTLVNTSDSSVPNMD